MGTNESVVAAENDLRSLILIILGEAFGDDWLDKSGLTPARIQIARGRMADEPAHRPGMNTSDNAAHYLDFYDLGTIIKKHWEKFSPVLGPKLKEFEFYFGRLGDLRNPDAHNRPLLPFENDLAAGISGEIRNRITIFRSTMAPNREYYPRIESVVDSFGNSADRAQVANDTGLELKIGDELSFSCSGWDPQGRTLVWQLVIDRKWHPVRATAEGAEVTLQTVITQADVREYLAAQIILTGSGAYHRNGGWDDGIEFGYSVRPPGF